MIETKTRPVRGWFIRLHNRRILMHQSEGGDFLFRFRYYDPNAQGRFRDRIRETKIALSDEAMGAMASLYMERGKSFMKLG